IIFFLTVDNRGVKEFLAISNVQVQAILCDEVQSFLGNIELTHFGEIIGLGLIENIGTLSVDETSPLPVELASFSAILKDKEVLLNWSTATEVNNYGFNVERMRDGEDWKALGFVEGNGNSNSPKEYSFVDNNVSNAGTYYYRLKQIDNDGAYEYSKSISVDFDSPAKFDLEQNYPNPFNPSTTIRFNLPDNEFVSLKIFNTLGEEVQTLFEGNLNAGTHTYNFNADGLPSGLYIYRLSTNAYSKTKKMMLMK
ncbi:MAG: T9SS type A sorting domain-containing protein, partial [Ignavibacteriaceae bacterium]